LRFNVRRNIFEAAQSETYHGNAVGLRYQIPGKEDIVGSICSDETENDGRNRSINGEWELACWCRKFSCDVNGLQDISCLFIRQQRRMYNSPYPIRNTPTALHRVQQNSAQASPNYSAFSNESYSHRGSHCPCIQTKALSTNPFLLHLYSNRMLQELRPPYPQPQLLKS
jgi:hypothetical protein